MKVLRHHATASVVSPDVILYYFSRYLALYKGLIPKIMRLGPGDVPTTIQFTFFPNFWSLRTEK